MGFKGCDSNFEVNIYFNLKSYFIVQMKELPCIKQYVLKKRLETIITMTNNLTDMIFDDKFYLGAWA